MRSRCCLLLVKARLQLLMAATTTEQHDAAAGNRSNIGRIAAEESDRDIAKLIACSKR